MNETVFVPEMIEMVVEIAAEVTITTIETVYTILAIGTTVIQEREIEIIVVMIVTATMTEIVVVLGIATVENAVVIEIVMILGIIIDVLLHPIKLAITVIRQYHRKGMGNIREGLMNVFVRHHAIIIVGSIHEGRMNILTLHHIITPPIKDKEDTEEEAKNS